MNTGLLIPLLPFGATLLLVVTGLLNFGARHLGLSFDHIAGDSSRHDEFKRAQLEPDAITFESD